MKIRIILSIVCAGILFSTGGCIIVPRHHETVVEPVVPVPGPIIVEPHRY